MDTIGLASDRICPDSGIENFSGTSGNSSVLLDNVTTPEPNSESVLENDLCAIQGDHIQDENDKKRLSKRISLDSGSAFEFVDVPLSEDDTPSPYHCEIFSRKVCPPSDLELPKGYGNQTSTKTCEMDLLEERDTFSPVSTGYSSDQQPDDACSSIDFIPDVGTLNGDNKDFEKKKGKPTSTKEEKQRQNEEIVIMETSSISSETGSWESVFPHRTNMEVKDCCRNFLHNERRSSSQCIGKSSVVARDTTLDSSDFITNPSSSSVTACFIDAATLLDESEVTYPSLAPKLPEGGCFAPKPEERKTAPEHSSDRPENSDKNAWPKKMHLDKLESFHKSFEMCKMKAVPRGASNSSSSSDDSPQKSGESANNLSDEEKLWKRENSKQSLNGRVEIKDQYNKQSPNGYKNIFSSSSGEMDTLLTRQDTFDMDENQTVQLRKDQERKQGNLVFQNSIQQFSGHALSPKILFPENDFAEYSTNPSNITWSEHDKHMGGCYTTGHFSDNVDEGETPSTRKYRTQSESEASGTCVLPDTPHNSIVQIDPNLKSSSKDVSYSGDSEGSIGIKIPKRSLRCDESAPIVSGGASIKDFTPKQCESPPVRRKTEACPIVSGGFHSLDFHSESDSSAKCKEKPKMSQSITSWVVDMSDCKSRRRRSTSSSSSTENTTRSAEVSSDRAGSGGSHKSGLGFYVSLNDMEPPKPFDSDPVPKMSRSLHEAVRKPTGFYVDLSESENSRNATPPPTANNQTPPVNVDKKNIFSMFIDFGEKKLVPKREPLSLASRLSNTLHQKCDTDPMKTSSSSTETLMSRSTHKQTNVEKLDSAGETLVGSSDESRKHSLLVDSDPPPVIRRIPQRNLKDESKRHSWNSHDSHSAQNIRKEHKRSASLTGDKGIMNILDKIPLISKTSSMSIDSSLSPFDDFTCSKSEMSTYSNNSHSGTSISIHSSFGENDNLAKKLKKRRRDVQINETFDKSSQGSLTDGVFSKDLSPASTTDTEDLTFQQEENECIVQETVTVKENGRPVIMETIIETKEVSSPKKEPLHASKQKTVKGDVKSPAHTMETLHATIEKQKQLLETVNEHVTETSTNFVKLSDMDKPFTKFELHSPDTMSKSVGNHRHISRLFQERSRPHSWAMTRSTGNTILNITSSVENLKSLTRLFPHLSREFSNSLPGDFSLDICNRSPNEMDYLQSDISADSSLASSISRSGMDESSISCRQPRRLGEDLLKMFLQEIATDVIVEVNGRRIKAHKCILKSRCQYFAAMLAGGWVQSAGNVISLPGYSYSAVHFALCHIYSGASHPPDGISLMELAALADYLGLEGLKEVTAYALKMNYCHNFHKPCSGCIDGILQVLPVALNHALDDLYRKCLKWTCRHYMKVWPTRPFAQLPSDILGRCRQQIVAHLTSETVLETILDCDVIIAQIAPCRWATSIENIVRDIMDAAYGYVSDHFASLIASDSFLSLGHDKSSNISRLESVLLRTASSLTPDQACRSYQRVTRLNAVLAAKVIKVPNIGEHAREFGEGVHEEEMDWNEEFIRLVSAILSAVEQCLTRQCARAMRVTAWQRMDLELRKKIQKLACLTEPLDLRRGKPVTKALSFNTGSRNQDLYQVKLAIQAHSKRALAQDTQLYRATAHTQTHDRNIQTNEKGVQANNEAKESSVKIFKSSSKAHVPVTQPTVASRAKMEKPSVLSHRRTQSEDSSTSLKLSEAANHKNASVGNVRLADIRPRYLEPRKARGPLKSQTSSNIPATLKGKAISSSDSSRTSSPATSKRIGNVCGRKFGPKSINMSLDSLSSPSKKSHTKGRVDTEISIDSLADSMKSSMKTEKTISQESLSNTKISRSNPVINKENQAVKQSITKTPKNKSISCQNTSGSSPSSITNKSSRLSSTNSSVNSPRDAFKNRSISVPAGQSTVVRRSFLSAKSREILARKSANAATNQPSGISRHQDKVIVVNKSASNSNIPTRKSCPPPTTLHLRKTAKVVPNTIISPAKSAPPKTVSNVKTTKTGHMKSEKHFKKNVDNKRENHEIELVIESPKELRVESKLERSSTFCKEAPDLPVSELQIID